MSLRYSTRWRRCGGDCRQRAAGCAAEIGSHWCRWRWTRSSWDCRTRNCRLGALRNRDRSSQCGKHPDVDSLDRCVRHNTAPEAVLCTPDNSDYDMRWRWDNRGVGNLEAESCSYLGERSRRKYFCGLESGGR